LPNLDSLKEILRTQGDESPLLNNAHDQLAIFRLWREVAGKQFSKNAAPVKFYAGVLEVVVSSSVWANQLALFSSEIVKKINRALGAQLVEKIKFRVGKINAAENFVADQPVTSGRRGDQKGTESGRTAEETLTSIMQRRKKIDERDRAGGMVECSICGSLHPKGEGDQCQTCRSGGAQEIIIKIKQLIRKAPWISFQDAKSEIPKARNEDFSKAKREETARLKDETEKLLREIKAEKKDSPKHKRLVSRLKDFAYGSAMLRFSKRPEELDEKILKQALRKDIGELLRASD